MKYKPNHLILIKDCKVVGEIAFEEDNLHTTDVDRIKLADDSGIEWDYLTISNNDGELHNPTYTDNISAHDRNSPDTKQYVRLDKETLEVVGKFDVPFRVTRYEGNVDKWGKRLMK